MFFSLRNPNNYGNGIILIDSLVIISFSSVNVKIPRQVKDRGSRTESHKIPKNWINHSFYTSQSQIRVTSTAQFIPRIKVASRKVNFVEQSFSYNLQMDRETQLPSLSLLTYMNNSVFCKS